MAGPLAPLGDVRVRPMFGGAGIYLDGTMFGLITRDCVVCFRTDAETRGPYEDAGMEPFVPFADGRMVMPYHHVPAEVLADGEVLCAWAQTAWEAAKRAVAGREAARRTVRRRQSPRPTTRRGRR